MALTKDEITAGLQALQDRICSALETADNKGKFIEDKWERPGGGGGRSRVIENAAILEKGGVNFSAVHGELPANVQTALGVNEKDFFATGVSIVMHPENPHVPIIHMNVRYFELNENVWWFGGGIDLTPHYVVTEQADWFHHQLKEACDKTDDSYYPKFAAWADKYFYIPHREESRGISGIFFDRLNTESTGKTKEELLQFLLDVGNSFAPVYTHLMELNHKKEVSELNKAWQMHRRSRYVEFNLVHDKGTKFGLDTHGRIDSILMSLPPSTGWIYTQNWPEGGEELKTQEYLRTVHVPRS